MADIVLLNGKAKKKGERMEIRDSTVQFVLKSSYI